MLDKRDTEFIRKRKNLISQWVPVAVIMLIVLAAMIVFMFIKVPYLVNPLHVAEALKTNSLNESLMTISVLSLPIVVLFIFFIVAIVVLYGFAIISREKRYIAIIESLENEDKSANDSHG